MALLRDTDTAVLLSVRIDGPQARGSERLIMALDTGATLVTLPTSIAEKLGYETRRPSETISIVAASGIIRAPLITLTAVEALGVEVRDVPAYCLDLPPQAHFRGLLGLSFLRHIDVDLHFKSGSIRFR